MRLTIPILLTTFFISASSMLFAQSITINTAKEIASNHLQAVGKGSLKSARPNSSKFQFSTASIATEKNDTLYFVLNDTINSSFVIVSADKRAYPILGYSLEGIFDEANQPPAFVEWMENRKQEITYIKKNVLLADSETALHWDNLSSATYAEAATTMEPLLQTRWNQSQYYNDKCPADVNSSNGYNGHVPTGCVATSMAQVLKYWNYPVTGTGSHSYTPSKHPEYGTLTANFGGTTYQWAQMVNDVTSPNDAVATLMFHCGVSVDMNYDPESSSASMSPTSFKNYFNYSSDAVYVLKSSYSESDWIKLLKFELDSHRPIWYRGDGPDGGHAFVCDGYQNTDYFHFNWGWGGYADNYFYVSNLNPGGSAFSSNQAAVIKIFPAKVPDAIGSITGLNEVCAGQTGVTYTVPAVQNAASYTWTLPSGATGTSSYNSITVNFGVTALSGSIKVKAQNSMGITAESSLAITVNALPATTGAITGKTMVCPGVSETYSIASVSGAVNYTWEIPAGWTGSSTSTSITVTPGSTNGTIKVKANNVKCSGTSSSLVVAIGVPTTPTSVSASLTTITPSQSTTLQVNGGALNSAPNWIWYTGSCGGTLVGTGSTLTVSPTTTTTYYVQATGCGVSTTCKSIVITYCSAPAAPASSSASIGSPSNGTSHKINFSVPTVSGANGYMWDYSLDGVAWVANWYDTSCAGTCSNIVDFGDKPNIPVYFRVRAYKCTPKQYSNYTYTLPSPIYTACDVPAPPTVNGATSNSLNLTLNAETPVANPTITTYSIYCTSTSQYLQSNGTLGNTEVFQTKSTWGTKTITGLSGNTQYCFYAKAKNNDGDIRFNASNSACGTTTTGICTTPGTPVSVSGLATGQTTANLSWSAGSPTGSTAVTYYWVVGTSASVTYNNGVAQGSATGTSASVTGLISGTTYYLRVFANTNCNNTSSQYGTSSAFTTSVAGCNAPTIQASGIAFDVVEPNSLRIAFTKGNGERRIIKANTVNSFTNPSNGTDPIANSNYSGSGEQVIYNGSISFVEVTGLTPNTNYYFRIYEFNCSNGSTVFLTSQGSNNPNSITTASPCPSQTAPYNLSPGGTTFPGPVITTIPSFSFATTGAACYSYEIRKEPYGLTDVVVAGSSIEAPPYTVSSSPFKDGVNYRWNVSASSSCSSVCLAKSSFYYFTYNSTICAAPTVTVNSPSGASPLIMNCTTTGGSGGTISYKWYSGTSCSGTVLGTSSTLSVPASGSYSCKAYISGAETTCSSCATGYATINATTCTNWAVTPSNQSVPSAGGSYQAAVSASGSCSYSRTFNDTWIHFTSSDGNGSFTYSVDPNTSSTPRTGTISINNATDGVNSIVTLTITQAGGTCTAPSASANSPSGAGPLTMTCSASGGSGGTIAYKWYSGTSCSGTVLGTSSTLSVSASGAYSCKAYITGYESTCYNCSTGNATIGNLACTNWSVTPNTQSVPSTGGEYQAEVSTSGSCSYSLTFNDSWIHFVNYPGGGSFAYSVDANTTCSTRIGTISVNNATDGINSIVTLTVTQAGSSAPSLVTVSGGGTYCGSTLLTASGGNGGTIYWQGTMSNGASLTIPSTNQTVTSSGTYYFRSYSSSCGWGTQGSALVTISSSVTPSISIRADQLGAICAGQSVIFTATPTNGGTSPSYQWKKNGTNISTGISYTSSSLLNGDVITCVMTSNSPCALPTLATSTGITMQVNSTMIPSVSISADQPGGISSGQQVIFTATPTIGGSAPKYQWKVNGVNVGDNNSTYTTTSLTNGQIVSCVMTSNSTCANPTAATSNSITMVVGAAKTASVEISIITGSNPTCTGESVTFKAIPTNGGTAPTFAWKLGSNTVGVGNSYSSNMLMNGQVITCEMTSNDPSVIQKTVTSNSITISVNAFTSPGVSIEASTTGAICAGQSVSFTATPINGGNSPSYLWKRNGLNVSTSPTYSSNTWVNGEVISCALTSNLACVSPSTAYSNTILMSVNSSPTPIIKFSGSLLESTPANGYQWYCNNKIIPNATNQTLSPTQGGDYYVIVTNNNCPSLPSNSLFTNPVSNEVILVNGLIKVYPNPTNGIITIEGLPETKKSTIAVYSDNGKLIMKKSTYSTQEEIDISTQVSGYYILIINEQSIKIIKK